MSDEQDITITDHERVAQAIAQAEAKTSGEIYCVVAHRSDSYFYPSAFYVFVSLLIVSLIAALALEAGWYFMRLPYFVGAQILAAATIFVFLAIFPNLRLRLTPRRLQFQQAHENAIKQFLARNIHLTAERTGVLLFVSLAERYAEVVADSGINAKVDQAQWNAIVGELIAHAKRDEIASGFVVAIGQVGGLLAAHFPPTGANPNELDDHLVEI